jgi:glycosyltransferase involved in cell wall biosynthesis
MFVRMASYFAEQGHSVDMVLMNAVGMEYSNELALKVEIVDLKTPRLWTSLPGFSRYLRKRKPDAVIAAMPLANGIAAYAVRLTQEKPVLILTEHNAVSLAFGDLDIPKYRPLMWALRFAYRFADAWIGVSGGVTARLKAIPGVQADRVRTIFNPAWSADMARAASQEVHEPWLQDQGVPVIIACGRLEAQKDYPTLIRGFADLVKHRKARLLILGEGSLKPRLEELVFEQRLSDIVKFVGFVSNPFAYVAKARCFVLASVHEGLPTVLIEAMACGTAVVSTDCPSGPSEILDGGKFGPLVPVGDEKALAAAIGQVLDNPLPADVLISRAREFSVEASASQYLDLIFELRNKRD